MTTITIGFPFNILILIVLAVGLVECIYMTIDFIKWAYKFIARQVN